MKMISRKLLMMLCCFSLLTGCAQATEETEMVVFKIGKADAVLLLSGSHAVLVDAGETEDGEEILAFLQQRGIHALDALVVTHYDKDHVGGADTVLLGVSVKAVYDANYETNTKHYQRYLNAIAETETPRTRVAEETMLQFGGMILRLMPTALAAAGDNDQSLVVYAEDAWRRFLLAGDAEEKRIEELLAAGLQTAAVLKMPHHGRYKENLPDLLAAVQPEFCVITDSAKNPAEEKTLALLSEKKIKAYRTLDGNIRVISDAQGVHVVQ